MSGKFKTTPLALGGETFQFARLSFGDMEELGIMELLEGDGFAKLPPPKQIPLVIDMAYRSLRRNEPAFDRKRIADMLDQDNCIQVFEVILGASGFKAAGANEPGNPAGGSAGTGQPSTPTLQPVSDGPSTTAGTN